MRDQTISWVALPNGYADARTLRLSVFVGPRLHTDEGLPKPTLSQFPDFIDWPHTLTAATNGPVSFSVVFGNGAPIAARIDPDSPAIRSDLWRGLFLPTTFVRPFTFSDHSKDAVRSFPAMSVAQTIEGIYTFFGRTGRWRPGIVEELDPTQIAEAERRLANLGSDTRTSLHQYAISNDNLLAPTRDFAQLDLFHRRQPVKSGYRPEPPELDFHDVISLAGEYSWILRQLGLIFDLLVPAPELSATMVPVIVHPSYKSRFDTSPSAGASRFDSLLPTICEITGTRFAATRRGQDIAANGMLNMQNTDLYGVSEVDVDGAGRRLLNFVANLIQVQANEADTPSSKQLPALRSVGLCLYRIDRAQAFHQDMVNASRHNAAYTKHRLDPAHHPNPALYAEDLARGFRVDVLSSAQLGWHSLSQRVGHYHFKRPGIKLDGHRDEGTVSEAATSGAATVDATKADLYVHERLARWTGWSLVAPRPGKSISTRNDAQYVDFEMNNPPGPDFPLEVWFAPQPGTLPILRFGESYRLRARIVDLAGNSVSHFSTDASTATPPFTYTRFEPVVSPAVLMSKKRTEGESVERPVIRDYQSPFVPTVGVERHIVAPKIAQLTAEEHGMFDKPHAKPDPNAWMLIRDRESNSFETAFNPQTNQFETTPQAKTDDTASTVGGISVPYFDVPKIDTPYLPDVFARGAAFRNLPGAQPGQVVKMAFDFDSGNSWPDARTFRLRVVGGDMPGYQVISATATESAVLQVTLPPASVVPVLLSCYVNESDLPQLGLWKWLMEQLNVGDGGFDQSNLQELAISGELWMITPPRLLTLVHATRLPLQFPGFVSPSLQLLARNPGDTFVTLSGEFSLDIPSTQKLDLIGSWIDQVDQPGPGPQPVAVTMRAHIGKVDVPADAPSVTFSAVRQEFGDTRYHHVNYSAIATSRFTEYFVQRTNLALTATPQKFAFFDPGVSLDAESVSVSLIGPGKLLVSPENYTLDALGGTIALSSRSPTPSGTEVEVVYRPVSTLDGSTYPEYTWTVDVLSTKRPAAPDIKYILPIWKREQSTSGDQITSITLGNALRIYLGRPWYVSGDGEQLAVVYAAPGFTGGAPPVLDPYLTQTGYDPIFQTGPTDLPQIGKTFPTGQTVSKRKDGLSPITLVETSTPAILAAYPVGYDPIRQLYFADISVDLGGGTHLPFIRMALVRYQPNSIAGEEVSTVALADFAQLLEDRFITVTPGSDDWSLHVSVDGSSYESILSRRTDDPSQFAGDGPSSMFVDVQVQDQQVQDPLLRWKTPNGQSTVQLTPQFNQGNFLGNWSGAVALPGPRGSQPMRLVVGEVEGLTTNVDTESKNVFFDTIEI